MTASDSANATSTVPPSKALEDLVARALCTADGKDPDECDWEGSQPMSDHYWKDYIYLAVAAIRALSPYLTGGDPKEPERS